METWKPIPKFVGLYEASSLGRVRSVERVVRAGTGTRVAAAKVLAPYTHTSGYLAVKPCVDGKASPAYVHRLVCAAFHGNPCADQEVLHRDGSKTNNLPTNLRWGTRVENMADNFAMGLAPIGEAHGMARLSAAQAMSIFRSEGTAAVVSKRFGVSIGTVRGIRCKRIWKSLHG